MNPHPSRQMVISGTLLLPLKLLFPVLYKLCKFSSDHGETPREYDSAEFIGTKVVVLDIEHVTLISLRKEKKKNQVFFFFFSLIKISIRKGVLFESKISIEEAICTSLKPRRLCFMDMQGKFFLTSQSCSSFGK